MCGETYGFFFSGVGDDIRGCDPRKWRDFWRVVCMTVYGPSYAWKRISGTQIMGSPPVYRKGSITKRITLRCVVSSLKFQIIIFVYYSNFMLHFILCFSKGIVPFWTDSLNRHDCKSNSVKYRFSVLAFRFLCKLVPCSMPIDHTKKLPTFFWNRKVHYCDSWVQCTAYYFISLRYVLILFYHLRVGFPYFSFPSGFPPKYCIYLLSHTSHMLRPSCPPRVVHTL